MLLVIPTTSAVRPTSYLTPQPYGYYPDHGYYSRYEAPRFTAPSYPSDLDFFRRPSAEELEEREYRRALEVVTSHRRRQAEKEAVIRRQQLAEAARQRYFSALAAELEQQRRKELLAARRAEFARLQQARARLDANERQNALKDFSRQCGCPQPITCQPHVAKRRPLADALKQRLATESDVDITELIENVLSSLAPRPAESNEAKDTSEGSSKFIEKLLSSIFPGLATSTQPQSTPPAQQAQPDVSDKGKGKARAVDIEEPQKPAEKPKSADETFADILRRVMELSKSAPTPRSPNEAGPSGSSHAFSTPAHPPVSEKEQAQVDRVLALSSVEHIQNTLTKLQADFVLPDELDHYSSSTDDRDETASVSSVSSSDLTKLVPYTRTNKPVYKYENELNGLLEELDRIDSHGDADVREKRKEVVKAVEKALENLENVVGESVGKRLSLIGTTEPPVEELKGFDVDDSTTEEVVLTQEQVETPVVDETAVVSEPFAPVEAEKTAITPAETATTFPIEGTLPEFSTTIIPETTVDLPFEPSSSQSDLEASSVTVTPASLEPAPATKTEQESPQVQADAQEVVDTFLLPENVSPPSPVQKPREMGSDIEDDVLSLDSDADKSDWSEVEH